MKIPIRLAGCPGCSESLLGTNEPRREKIGFLHMQKQRRRSASG